MTEITAPQKDQDIRDLWKVVAALVKFCNTLGNLKVVRGNKDQLLITDSNATLMIDDQGLSLIAVEFCEGNGTVTRMVPATGGK